MNSSHKQGRHSASQEKGSGLSTFKKFTAVSVVGIVAALSMMSAASVSKVAYITDGEDTYTVTTADTDTSDIIEQAGLELSYYDKAVVTEESSERIDIDIIRAFSVKISVDGGARFVDVTAGTVADALEMAEINFSANDFITPSLSTELEEDMVIEVERGVKIYLTCDGTTNIVYVPQGKVGDALDYVGYQLSEDDNVNVDVSSDVTDGMRINVDRVEYKTTYEKEPIEPTIIEEACNTLPVGQQKVKQEGKEGVLEITVEEKYVNGELAESKEVSRQVLKKPVDRIILIGTLEEKEETTVTTTAAPRAVEESESVFADFENTTTNSSFGTVIDSAGNSLSYSTVLIGNCTAYYEPGGITSTGTAPKYGTVAVNPNVIPYGSRLYICSADGSYVYGYAVAEDTGGACMAGDIVADLYMESEEACNAFGRQELCVYILN